jgi:hypothetical protein
VTQKRICDAGGGTPKCRHEKATKALKSVEQVMVAQFKINGEKRSIWPEAFLKSLYLL